jgi:uncharacterized phage infection (PIP) family protein YhgE
LREVTLNLWVPELYPTTGQEAAEAAQASLDAAIKVTESAQTIREDTVALAATLRSVETDTNKYAVGMKELASQVHGSIDPAAAAIRDLGSQLDRFNQAMTRWNDFETALKVLYSKLEAGQSLLIEQAGTVRTQIDLQTTEFQSMAAGLRDTHKLIFAEVRDRMNGLQVPFKDAAAQMLDQAEILRLFAQKVVETSDKTALQLHADYEKTATALSDIAAKLVLVAAAEARTSQLGETLRSGLDQQQVAATRFEALANRVLTALESGSQRQADLLGAIEANLRASREWSPVAMGEAAYGAGARPTYAAPPPSTYPAQPSRSYPDPVRHPPDLQRAASAAPFAPSQQPVPFSQAQPRLPATKWQPGPSGPPSSPPDEVKRPWWRLGL